MSIFPKGIFDAEKQEAPELTKNTARKRRQERRQKAGPERRGAASADMARLPSVTEAPARQGPPVTSGRRASPVLLGAPAAASGTPALPDPEPFRPGCPSRRNTLPDPVPPAPEIFPESPARLQEANAGTSRERIAAAAAPDRTQAPGAPGTLSHHPAFYTVRPYIINIFFFYTFQGSENHTSVRILSIHLIEHFQVRSPSSVRILSIQLFLHFQGRKKDRRQRPRGPHEFQYLYIVVLLAFKSLAASVTVPSGWAFFHSLTAASFVPDPGGRPFPRLQFSL